MEENVIEDIAEQITVTEENIQNLITSKSFKNRIIAYQKINEHPAFVNHLQNETLAVALEVALDNLLQFEGLRSESILNIYNQFSQSKASIKSKISDLISKVFETDKKEVVEKLCEMTLSKNAKVAAPCISKLKDLIKDNIEYFRTNNKLLTELLLPKLDALFSSADKDVKTETHNLTVILYNIFYDELYKFIENIKPILLNALKEIFNTIEVPKTNIKLSDFDFEKANWKERVTAMTFLRDNIHKMSNAAEFYSLIARKTKDSNINVVVLAAETIKLGKIAHPDCIRGIIERFKDKKAQLTTIIKEALECIKPDPNLYTDFLNAPKGNPEIKSGILEALAHYDSDKIKFLTLTLGKLLEDSSADVRGNALNILSNFDDLDELSEAQRAKLQKSGLKPETKLKVDSNISGTKPTLERNSKLTPTKLIPTKLTSSKPNPTKLTPERNSKKTSMNITEQQNNKRQLLVSEPLNKDALMDYNLDINEKVKVNDFFNSKYSFFLEKDWNKRFECLKDEREKISGEGLDNIALFLLASKESNVLIIYEMLSYFTEGPVPFQVLFFLFSKITEPKLKNTIIQIFKKYSNQEYLTRLFIHQILNNKTGKKCACLLEVFSTIVYKKSKIIDDFISSFTCLGIIERKAFIDFRNTYKSLSQEQDVTMTTDINNTYNTFNTGYTNNNKLANNINMTKLANSTKLTGNTNMNTNTIRVNIQIFDEVGGFTKEFINLFKTDLNRAASMVEAGEIENLVSIINLYCINEVPSTYFNSLILNLIYKKYLLNEVEAQILISYMVEHNLLGEMEIIDRIYPATKIYKIIRNINDSFTFILLLLQKYVKNYDFNNLDGYFSKAIKEKVRVCEDFIGFINEVEQVISMKQELKETYDNVYDDSFLRRPSHLADDIANLSISSTPKKKKAYENSFEIDQSLNSSLRDEKNMILDDDDSFNREILNDNQNVIVEANLSDDNNSVYNDEAEITKEDILKINRMISNTPNLVLTFSNIFIKKIITNLMKSENLISLEMKELILNCILKMSQSLSISLGLTNETLTVLHIYLISEVKDNVCAADILINLCLKCDLCILKVYFDLLKDSNEILMKLIWRHSKRADYTVLDNVRSILGIIDYFYITKRELLSVSENVLLKVCLLHLKECIASYSDNVRQLGIGSITKSVVDLLINYKELDLVKIRECFKSE